jgi:hypothetical protein
LAPEILKVEMLATQQQNWRTGLLHFFQQQKILTCFFSEVTELM